MSYIKNVWANGDTITAEKLNNIEDGIAAISLPDIDPATDAGKVLTVGIDGNAVWATPGQSNGAVALDQEEVQ